MRDKITLGDDVFSAEYWAHDRVRLLVEAFADMMPSEPSYANYMAWWLSRCSGDESQAFEAAKSYRAIAHDIRDNGYDSERWRSSDRNFDPVRGQGAITVKIGSDGTISPWDGAHRSAIMRCLGRPVEAEVFERAPDWQHLKEYHKTLYTPYPHPDFASHPVTRRNPQRFETACNLASIYDSACVVGACTGLAALVIAGMMRASGKVIALEPQTERRALLDAVASRHDTNGHVISSGEYAHEHDYSTYEIVLACSIYQHAASSQERWSEICERLAAVPRHIIELPGNHEHQWHDRFREQSDGRPQEAIIRMLIQAGRYDPPKVLYTDHTYANRQTILLERP